MATRTPKPKISTVLDRVQELFFAKLQSKTGWGRNEIMALYKEAENEALREHLDG